MENQPKQKEFKLSRNKKLFIFCSIGLIALIVLAALFMGLHYDSQSMYGTQNALRFYGKSTQNGTVGSNEDKAKFYATRGVLEHCEGQLYAALRDYRHSLQFNSVNDVTLANMADIDFRFDRIDVSSLDCNASLTTNPKNAVALNNRAQTWLRKQNYQMAVTDASDALANTNSDEAQLKVSILLIRASAYRHLWLGAQSDADISTARSTIHVAHAKLDVSKSLETKFGQKVVGSGFILCSNAPSEDTEKLKQFSERFYAICESERLPVSI